MEKKRYMTQTLHGEECYKYLSKLDKGVPLNIIKPQRLKDKRDEERLILINNCLIDTWVFSHSQQIIADIYTEATPRYQHKIKEAKSTLEDTTGVKFFDPKELSI